VLSTAATRSVRITDDRGYKDGPRRWAASVDHLSRPATSRYTPMSTTMGTPSSPVSQVSSLRQAYRWLTRGSVGMLPACPGGVPGGGRVGSLAPAECRKGSSMAKVKRPRRRQKHPVRSCAWCTHPVHGDAVTVTFPDKAQATFHVACLDQYRAVMWPWAAR
jgi:hypothetical protein